MLQCRFSWSKPPNWALLVVLLWGKRHYKLSCQDTDSLVGGLVCDVALCVCVTEVWGIDKDAPSQPTQPEVVPLYNTHFRFTLHYFVVIFLFEKKKVQINKTLFICDFIIDLNFTLTLVQIHKKLISETHGSNSGAISQYSISCDLAWVDGLWMILAITAPDLSSV